MHALGLGSVAWTHTRCVREGEHSRTVTAILVYAGPTASGASTGAPARAWRRPVLQRTVTPLWLLTVVALVAVVVVGALLVVLV